jgi:hypothetical protein
MNGPNPQPLPRVELYSGLSVVFLALVAVHHAPRAPAWIQHLLTAVLILMAAIAAIIAWSARSGGFPTDGG